MLRKVLIIVLSIVFTTFLASCGQSVDSKLNSGFESGDLSKWTAEGDAFSGDVVITDETFGQHQRKYFHEGTYHLSGAVNSGKTGSLTSSVFKLKNTGYITFLIGGGFDYTKTYVAVYDSNTDELIEKRGNHLFSEPDFTDIYVRVFWDLSPHLEKDLYIKLVDNDSSTYYDYLNFDGLKINLTQDELDFYEADAMIRSGIAPGEHMVDAMNRYIEMNSWKINIGNKPNYHVTGEIGWINDPNGFVYYNNQYHLFYQHNPRDVVWGPMHWGHVVSDDLIKWEYLPIAIAPDQTYDSHGAFSGSAIEKDGLLYLIYTGNMVGEQVQAIAYSEDGIHFEKYENNPVVDSSHLPASASTVDFRDPKVWFHDGYYYMVVGSRQSSNSYGQVLLFKSLDLKDWRYAGKPYFGTEYTSSKLGRMWECPDIFELSDRDVLIMSPQDVPGHRNGYGTVYIVGDLNYTNGQLENIIFDDIEEIDYGFDFYAPQTMIDDQGRRIMVAWMQSWNRTPLTSTLGFSGMMTLPRELKLIDNILYQIPVEEIENYRTNQVIESFGLDQDTHQINGVSGNSQEIIITLEPGLGKSGVKLFKGDNEETSVYYENGFVYLDRTKGTSNRISPSVIHNITKAPVELINGKIELRIFVDKFSVEVFINGGRKTITSTVLPSINALGIEFFSDSLSNFTVESYKLDLE